MNRAVESLYEELAYLCEVRGELDPEANARVERRIEEVRSMLLVLENTPEASDAEQ